MAYGGKFADWQVKEIPGISFIENLNAFGLRKSYVFGIELL
jgi:hypothetical protein